MKKFLASRTQMEIILIIPVIVLGTASLVANVTEKRRIKSKSQRGASVMEYLLLVSLIAVVCISAIRFLSDDSKKEQVSTPDNQVATTIYRAPCSTSTTTSPIVVTDAC